jgi:hypothetical protein
VPCISLTFGTLAGESSVRLRADKLGFAPYRGWVLLQPCGSQEKGSRGRFDALFKD